MYDTIELRLRAEDAEGIDFLSEVPYYFNVTGDHLINGYKVLSGRLNGFKISVSNQGVSITDGSLAKYYLGDNIKTLSRNDVENAIEKLSDTLHLPLNKSTVTRLDTGQNFILKHPVEVYLNHLGLCYPNKRLEQPDGLYYTNSKEVLALYNKLKEQKSRGQPIPNIYKGKNLLRCEARFKRQLHKTFNVPAITGRMLYDEMFYKTVIDKWAAWYNSIKKINDITLNFDSMKTNRDLYSIGILSLVGQVGGELAFTNQINEAYKLRAISKKQSSDLKKAIVKACQIRVGIVKSSEVITELDQKVVEIVQRYR